jgi:hypothetical protein
MFGSCYGARNDDPVTRQLVYFLDLLTSRSIARNFAFFHRVRGVVMNPVDHPMGGGEGRTSGGGHPVSPLGQLAKGYPTRKRSKRSNHMILVRRNGKKFKKS